MNLNKINMSFPVQVYNKIFLKEFEKMAGV